MGNRRSGESGGGAAGRGGRAGGIPDALREQGSAVTDFAFVSGLLALLFLALLQLGLVLHVRNTLMAAAAEGARMGARAGATPADGVERTRELITGQLSARYAQSIVAGVDQVAGARVVVVRVQAPVPVIGPLGIGEGFDVLARAYAEQQ